MDVAIVLLNWNGASLLKEFLPSVVKYSQQARIYIIDNGSTDSSVSFIESNYPTISLIKLNENLGFCGGYNKGLMSIDASYYVLLNTDVEVTDGWLNDPIHILSHDSSVGICQPKIKSWKEKNSFEYAGAAGGYIDYLGYPFCRGRLFNHVEEDKGQYNDNKEIFWASGACLFIKAELFKLAGGFDTRFFAHMEEIDLCWRIKNMGYKAIYCGKSTVYHVGGATLTKNNPKKTFLNFRNSLLYLVKNLPAHKYLPKIFARLILDGLAGIYFLCKGDYLHTLAIIKAHVSFYSIVHKFVGRSKGHAFEPVYKSSIVLDHYFKRKKQTSELQKLKFPDYTSLS